MVKLFRFIGLISQSIFIQFAHLFGLVAFVIAAAVGYLRLPSWLVPVLAVVFGVVADKFIDESAVSAILEKAASANQRGGFLILVYFVITASTTGDLTAKLYNLLTQPECHVGDVIMSTDVENLDLLPSNIDLSAAELQLVSEVGREYALGRALAPIIDEYDVILIDCQPSLGLLTLNALTASSGVIIPMECEYFALRGVKLLKDTVDKVTARLNPNLQIIGVLPTMYDPRTLHSREVLQTVKQAFGDTVFQTSIARTIKFPDAAVAGEPITSSCG